MSLLQTAFSRAALRTAFILAGVACLARAQTDPCRDPFAPGAGPAPDPFAAPASENPDLSKTKQITITVDWIRLPHRTASQLLHAHLKHSCDGDPMRAAAVQLVAEGKAQRLDLNAMLVRSGQRSASTSASLIPFPTEHWPAEPVIQKTPQGDAGTGQFVPPRPCCFEEFAAGRIFHDLEADCSEDGKRVVVRASPEWNEISGWRDWGSEGAEVRQPVVYDGKVSTPIFTVSGRWTFAALLTPPPELDAGAPEFAPLPADRVLVFVRAAVDGIAKAPYDAGWSGGAIIAEWIEISTADFMALAAAHPLTDGLALRRALEAKLNAGTASLVETAAVSASSGQRTKVESWRKMAYPTEFDPSGAANVLITANSAAPAISALEDARRHALPPTPQNFEYGTIGSSLEAEMTLSEDRLSVTVPVSTELRLLNEIEDRGAPGFPVMQPRFQTVKYSGEIRAALRRPVLVTTFDALMPRGALPPDVRERKVLLFVRVFH